MRVCTGSFIALRAGRFTLTDSGPNWPGQIAGGFSVLHSDQLRRVTDFSDTLISLVPTSSSKWGLHAVMAPSHSVRSAIILSCLLSVCLLLLSVTNWYFVSSTESQSYLVKLITTANSTSLPSGLLKPDVSRSRHVEAGASRLLPQLPHPRNEPWSAGTMKKWKNRIYQQIITNMTAQSVNV